MDSTAPPPRTVLRSLFVFSIFYGGMIASVVSQIVDTVLFITISFYGERPIAELMAGQMLTKVVLSVVLVPFLITGFVTLGRKLDR